MTDETKAKIAAIVAKYERTLARHRQPVQREPAEQAFVEQDEELRKSVIEPTSRSIGDAVAERGDVYRIHAGAHRTAIGGVSRGNTL